MSGMRIEALQLIHRGLLESACAILIRYDIALDAIELSGLIDDCLKQAETIKSDGNVRESIQYQRRAAALALLRNAGHLSGAVIPSVVLPDGYCGKIMLAKAEGDLIHGRTFLRSGDDWHREILRSFEAEVCDYGFENFQIFPQGGAFAEFQADGTIVLCGFSEEFGMCRREDALTLVKEAFPDRMVIWSEAADI
jgi:hypothetical protein